MLDECPRFLYGGKEEGGKCIYDGGVEAKKARKVTVYLENLTT